MSNEEDVIVSYSNGNVMFLKLEKSLFKKQYRLKKSWTYRNKLGVFNDIQIHD